MNQDLMKQRTQQKLAEALFDLCEKNAYLDITAMDICKQADVARSTFYRYYSSKDDLLKSIEQNYIQELKNVCSGFFKINYQVYKRDPHIYNAEIQRIWEYHYQTRRCCRMLLSSNGDPHFTYLIYTYLEKSYASVLEKNGLCFGPHQDLVIKFQVNGILAVLYHLLSKDDIHISEYSETLTKLFVTIPLDEFAREKNAHV